MIDTCLHQTYRRSVLAIAAGIIPLLAFAWVASLPMRLGFLVYTEQFLAAMLTLALICVFTRSNYTNPVREWGDTLLTAASVTLGTYFAIRYPVLQAEAFYRPTEAITVSLAVLALLMEAGRRSNARVLMILFFILLLYAFFGHNLPGTLAAPQSSPVRIITYLGIDTGALLGMPLAIAAGIVVAFLAFGQFLQTAGGADFITDFARAGMGRFRGGNSKIAIVASALFGSISGSAVSNVVSTGTITIPLMIRSGHKKESAGAIEATASTGGQLMPPVMGAAAFLMAEIMGVPYQTVAIAAIVPALLFYFAIFLQADMEAARLNIAAVPRADRQPAGAVARRGLPVIAAFSLLLVLLFVLNIPAELGAFLTAAIIAVLSLFWVYGQPRGTFAKLIEATVETGTSAADIILTCAVAGLIIGLLQTTGLSFSITLMLLDFANDQLFTLLVVVAVLCVLLGMGMPSTAVYMLVATLAAQPLVQLGIEPLAAHMFVFYFGMLSMITPPVALAAFAAANIAKAPPMKTAAVACVFGWPAFLLPFLFVYSPSLLLVGSWAEIGWTVLCCTVGVTAICWAIGGFILAPIAVSTRVALSLAGIACFLPMSVGSITIAVNVAGLIVTATLWGVNRRQRSQLTDTVSA